MGCPTVFPTIQEGDTRDSVAVLTCPRARERERAKRDAVELAMSMQRIVGRRPSGLIRSSLAQFGSIVDSHPASHRADF